MSSTQTYTIEIDEVQRCRLFFAISKLPPEFRDEEFNLLSGMLAELPQVEKVHPGIVHGFCY
jgi:hypothetical protein